MWEKKYFIQLRITYRTGRTLPYNIQHRNQADGYLYCCVYVYVVCAVLSIASFIVSTVTLDKIHVDKVKVCPIRHCVYNKDSLRSPPLLLYPCQSASPVTLLAPLLQLRVLFHSPFFVFSIFSCQSNTFPVCNPFVSSSLRRPLGLP